MIPRGLFVTGTTTGAGKTTLTSALARALLGRGRSVAAIKPFETGVDPAAEDALALAAACARPELASDPAWYRARRPVSPYAATLEGEDPPRLDAILTRIAALDADVVLCEGAGGLLVPLDRERTMADLASALAFPLLVVAPDRLGVLSDVLAVHEAAARRGLPVAAIALSRTTSDPDPSVATNQRILAERLPVPVVPIAHRGAIDPLLAVLGCPFGD